QFVLTKIIGCGDDPALPYAITLALHDALPISGRRRVTTGIATLNAARRAAVRAGRRGRRRDRAVPLRTRLRARRPARASRAGRRSEEHTSELQSRENIVCRLLLEIKNKIP